MENKFELTLIEALCVMKCGWKTEKEKELFDYATECEIKSNDRYTVEPINGVNGFVSVKDTKYDVIFELNLADKTSKVRPLKYISSGILKQSILDFNVFVVK